MVFSSLEFLFLFLTVTLTVYFIIPKKYIGWRNVALFAVSLLFYGWGEPVYVFLMVISILLSYFYGFMVGKYRERSEKKARLYLVLALITNLGLLGFFKYTDFFIGILNALPSVDLPLLGLPLPIGISFYSFQILSYVIDVYKGDTAPQKNPLTLGTYVTLFPQLIAGPIVRYKDVEDQLSKREQSFFMFASGVKTFLAGLAKKVLLANVAAESFETLKALPEERLTVLGAWLGIVFFAFQIYFDFSGYSDMAIGLGKMFGFRFLENFDYPYISKSVTEFWRRWHISLSTWFREYVYFPLGGSRVDKKWKVFRNLLAVWLFTGFWHGANWNFILWGLLFFFFLVLEKTFLLKVLNKIPAVFGHIYTLLVVLFSWLLFHFEDLGQGFSWLLKMLGVGTSPASPETLSFALRSLPMLLILAVGSTPLPKKLYEKLTEKGLFFRVLFALGGVAVLLLSVASLVSSGFNPFIYFNF
jgi:alginate O-acetyltransferase complex protein AlgI